jgi:uroporphyrin-III C-methyltransferase/precorrin-2 dehydrogenase/sirohydrochlorin ferrochelatase/uroporphyrin-III C-methyltransferase
MSSETLDDVVENLMENNIEGDKLLAVIEQATTPYQHVYISSFQEYEKKLKGRQFISPSLVIIGKVVALYEKFNWIKNSELPKSYFNPVNIQYSQNYQSVNFIEHVSRA